MQNLAISLGVMQLARKIPFDNPQVLDYVRIAYVASQAFALLVYYYASSKIKAKNDQTMLKYVEPAGPLAQEPGKLVTTTVRDYDLAETSKLIKRGVHFRCDDGLPPFIPQIFSTPLRASHNGLQVPIRGQDRQDSRSW